jgi:hypothetical protein
VYVLIGGEILKKFRSIIFAKITRPHNDSDISIINPNMCISIEGYICSIFILEYLNFIVLIIRNEMVLLFVGVWTSKKLLRTKSLGMELFL